MNCEFIFKRREKKNDDVTKEEVCWFQKEGVLLAFYKKGESETNLRNDNANLRNDTAHECFSICLLIAIPIISGFYSASSL